MNVKAHVITLDNGHILIVPKHSYIYNHIFQNNDVKSVQTIELHEIDGFTYKRIDNGNEQYMWMSIHKLREMINDQIYYRNLLGDYRLFCVDNIIVLGVIDRYNNDCTACVNIAVNQCIYKNTLTRGIKLFEEGKTPWH